MAAEAKRTGFAKKKEVLSLPSYKHNLGVLSFCRILTSVIGGAASGVLGVTGWRGFLVYLVIHVLLAFPLLLKAGFDGKKYFNNWSTLLVSMVFTSQGILSFFLFWMIFYNVAHVF
ncbi:hypothetical protein BSKO_09797 [Bryopsis sp. KO-2023]|nr:hypothetical protein BSKO_09797 [Bryopsis sp. KO-2023]